MTAADRWVWPILPALLLLAVGLTTEIRIPGIYMDEANPDYFVPAILNPEAYPVRSPLPGNVIADKIPVLGDLYYGTLPVYIGLPFYAIFGTGAVGIRLVDGVFAALVVT